MKISLVLLFVLTNISGLFAAETNFRSTHWGMTRAEVMATESQDPITAEEAVLTYSDTLCGVPVLAVYVFHPWAHYLSQGLYLVQEDSTSSMNYFFDYQKFHEYFMELYGEPDYETSLEGNTPDKNLSTTRNRSGMSDSMTFISRWKTEDTVITLELKDSPEEPPLTILYMSTNFLFTERAN